MATPKLRLITSSKKLSTVNYQTLPMGVHLHNGRYVAAGARIITQSAADSLPSVPQRMRDRIRKQRLSANARLRLVTTEPKNQATNFMAA